MLHHAGALSMARRRVPTVTSTLRPFLICLFCPPPGVQQNSGAIDELRIKQDSGLDAEGTSGWKKD